MKCRNIRIKVTVSVGMLLCFLSGCGSMGNSGEEKLMLLEDSVSQEQSVPKSLEAVENVATIEATEADGFTEPVAECETVQTVTVHVCGAVAAPGVYELEAQARVADAVEAAGGSLDDAAVSYLNQAAFLSDGQQVYMPTEEEIKNGAATAFGAGTASGAAAASGGMQTESQQTLININTASKSELMTLPGVGEAKAESIIRYRESAGGFLRIEDIMQVEGIKDGLFQKIKEQITVDIK